MTSQSGPVEQVNVGSGAGVIVTARIVEAQFPLRPEPVHVTSSMLRVIGAAGLNPAASKSIVDR